MQSTNQSMKKVNLFNRNYNKRNVQLLLEQYKLLVESADRITEKRQNTNNFYLAVNSFIFALASYLVVTQWTRMPVLISVMGLLVSLVWLKNIKSYKNLNAAKFKVIHELEERLPTRIYQKEDQNLRNGYYQLTSIEKWVPIIFAILYLGIILAILLL